MSFRVRTRGIIKNWPLSNAGTRHRDRNWSAATLSDCAYVDYFCEMLKKLSWWVLALLKHNNKDMINNRNKKYLELLWRKKLVLFLIDIVEWVWFPRTWIELYYKDRPKATWRQYSIWFKMTLRLQSLDTFWRSWQYNRRNFKWNWTTTAWIEGSNSMATFIPPPDSKAKKNHFLGRDKIENLPLSLMMDKIWMFQSYTGSICFKLFLINNTTYKIIIYWPLSTLIFALGPPLCLGWILELLQL